MRWIIILFTVFVSSIANVVFAAETTNVSTDFAITSSATSNQGILPVLYTCDGTDISPSLTWSHAPDKTQTYALIFSDLDAPGGTFYHWILYNIPKDITTLREAINPLPKEVIAGKNSWGKSQYSGPCPPKGASHHYVFTLYALDNKLTLEPNIEGEGLLAGMKDHVIQKTEFSVVYSRWIN